MNGASIDGVRPATYYINLKSTHLWPKYQIPTLTAHEGLPGHAWQGAFLTDIRELRRRARTHMERGAVTEGYKADRMLPRWINPVGDGAKRVMIDIQSL